MTFSRDRFTPDMALREKEGQPLKIGPHCSILGAQAPCGNAVWASLLRLL